MKESQSLQVLASQFENQFVIISDLAVKTTYFTVCNLVRCTLPPLTPTVRPLSNVALSLEKCQSLIQVPTDSTRGSLLRLNKNKK